MLIISRQFHYRKYSLTVNRVFLFKAIMVDQKVDCFLIPKNPNSERSIKNIHLPNLQEIELGRGIKYGIMDLACSKRQLILEADIPNRTVKIRRIGRNPSILAGFPMEQNEIYTARDGMTLKVSPDIELLVKFQEENNDLELLSGTNKSIIWNENSSGTLLFCKSSDVKIASDYKIAGFDLDFTLIATKSGYTFPSNDDDWKLWHAEVKNRLPKLASEGFSLVIFTNQFQLCTLPLARKKSFKKKIENIINSLNVPLTVLISTTRDRYRKPSPGMWEHYISELPGRINYDSSFYVGDAAGRIAITKPKISGDFEITDRLFARNIGVKFYTPEEFFLNEPPREYKDVTFHPHEFPTENYPDLGIPSSPPELIVMVGSPASGKSYFTQKMLEPKGYIRISRDELKLWTKCRDKIINSISRKQNIVYDATNPDILSRKTVLDICIQQNFTNIRCFVMSTTEDRCAHNNKFRQLVQNSMPVPHTAIVSFNKKFEEPTTEEGFISVVKIPFVPNFQNKEHELFYKKYLLGKKK